MEKNCRDCECFLQYYIKKNLSLRKSRYGQCKNKKLPFDADDSFICKHFAKRDTLAEKHKLLESATKNLDEICFRINDIKNILSIKD